MIRRSLSLSYRGGNMYTAFFICAICFFPSFAHAASYSTLKRHQVDGSFMTQTLTKAGSPYMIPSGCNNSLLDRGDTLTIEAGVVVKFGPPEVCGNGAAPSQLLVYGNLDVRGTPSDPVIFTSWHDDAAGGDTNGNGSATNPQRGDWLRIQVGGAPGGARSALKLKNVIIRYASSPLVIYPSVDPEPMSGLDISHNVGYGIDTHVDITATSSRFFDNYFGGINASHPGISYASVDARNSWWGDDSGPTVASNPGGKGQKIVGDVQYDPWVGKPPAHDPVILIPGILGTEMKRASTTLWLDLFHIFHDHGDEFLDPLALNQNVTPIDTTIELGDVIRKQTLASFPVFNYFYDLIDEFKTRGYQENTDLFVFPYDWRMSIQSNSEKLKTKIDQVLAQTHAQKIDLFAHSMGGLVAKRYVFEHPDNHVDTLVYLGTPQFGSPKAAKALMFGDAFDIPFLNPGEMKKLSLNMPSAYELLPTPSYTSQFGPYITDKGKQLSRTDAASFMAEQGVRTDMIQNADTFHTSAFDNFVPSGVNVYTIAGCNQSTIGKIERRNSQHSGITTYWETAEYDVLPAIGDGTVPLASADSMNIPDNRRYYFTQAEHAKMPSQDGARQLIAQIISGTLSSALPTAITQDKTACKLRGRMLKIHSPVDIHIYDSAGNHVGMTDSGDVETHIPGVSYDDIAGEKFVFVPEGQTYQVRLQGTGDGVFQFRVADIQDSQIVGTVYYNNVPATNGRKGSVELGASIADTVLRMDLGNGTQTIIPQSAVLNASQSADVERPTTAMLVNGTPMTTAWYKNPLVSFTATDTNAGVLKTEYTMDNGATWQTYSAPFTVGREGKVIISYFSTDRAGNREDIKQAAIKVDTTAPEVAMTFRSTSNFDMVINGTDESSNVFVWNYGDYTAVTDEAGNETRVYISRSFRGAAGGALVTKITYNGIPVFGQPGSSIRYAWSTDQSGRITLLQQDITKDGNTVVNTLYQLRTGVTSIRRGPTLQQTIVPGMAVLTAKTNKGNIIYNF